MSQVTLAWAVNNMTRVISDGFVIVVDWSCTAGAVDSQTPPQPLPVGAFYGGQTRYENNPDRPGFIPYDQLTQEIVLGWVFDSLGPEKKAEIEADRTAKVEKQLHPVTGQGLPWAA